MTSNPSDRLRELILGKWISQSISVVARLGIADLLTGGPKNYGELAQSARVDPKALYRLMRALSVVGIFAERGDGRFEQTPMSECLRSDIKGSWKSFAALIGTEFSWRSWGDLFYSVKSGKTAFNHVYGKPFFEYLLDHREDASVFDAAMVGITSNQSSAVAAAFDFSRFKKIVDVGGGQGAFLKAILRANSDVKGILFDLPEVVEGAKRGFVEEGLMGRCEIVGGNFFDSVPQGGDAYVLSRVIHDWDDERALQILHSCYHAMPEGGRLLLLESVIRSNEPSFGKLIDLEMLVMLSGCERTEKEYRELLEKAGFRIVGIVRTKSAADVIEAVRA